MRCSLLPLDADKFQAPGSVYVFWPLTWHLPEISFCLHLRVGEDSLCNNWILLKVAVLIEIGKNGKRIMINVFPVFLKSSGFQVTFKLSSSCHIKFLRHNKYKIHRSIMCVGSKKSNLCRCLWCFSFSYLVLTRFELVVKLMSIHQTSFWDWIEFNLLYLRKIPLTRSTY